MRYSFLQLAMVLAMEWTSRAAWAQQAATVPTSPVPSSSTSAPAAASPKAALPPLANPNAPVTLGKSPGAPPAPVKPLEPKAQTSVPLSTTAPVRPALQKFSDNLAILLLSIGTYTNPGPEQRNRILMALGHLKNLSREVQPLLTLNASDPVLRYLSWDLSKQFLRIEAAFNAGTINYARYLLRQTTQYCIGSSIQGKNQVALQFPDPPLNLGELEKAEYFSATKRYEEAMLAYERVLGDKLFKSKQPELWEKTVTNLMATTIRIRNTHISLEMASALLEEGGYSNIQKEMLQSWRASAKAWTAESIGKKLTGADILLKAQQVIDKGTQLSARGASFGSLEYMHAMSLLNELTLSGESDALKAKGFQLSGKTSEKLPSIFLWMHADAYYEACVRAKPHSPEAKECVRLLETFQSTQKDVVLDTDKFRQLQDLAK